MHTRKTRSRVARAASLLALLSVGAARAESIEIAGRVVLPGDVPLAEAQVTLLPDSDPLTELLAETGAGAPKSAIATRTDAVGRYRVEAPHAGMWKVRIESPGFAPVETRLAPLIEPVVLEDAHLGPSVGLSVQVLGPGGAPVGGASVAVTQERERRFGRGKVWTAPDQRSRTTADGKASFLRGENVELRISVLAPGLVPRVLAGQRGTAARIELAQGTPRALEVVSSAGQPIAGVSVAIGEIPHVAGTTDARGRVQLALDAQAPFDVRARHADGRSVTTRLGPPPADPAGTLRLVLPDQHALVGKLIDAESRRAVTGGVVWDLRDTSRAVTTDSAGAFVYSGPLGARIELAAGAPGYLEAESSSVQLQDDGRPGPTLALKPAAAIAGTVVDAEGHVVALAEVELEASAGGQRMRIEIGRPGPKPRTLTGKRGEFRLGKIDPERAYELHVSAAGFAPATVDVSGLEPYRTRSGIRVELARGVALAGTIVDEDDVPLTGAAIEAVEAQAEGGMAMMRMIGGERGGDKRTAVSDQAGRFELSGLARTKLDLTVSRAGYAKRRLPGVAVAPEESRTDLGRIALAPGERLMGTVRDDSGLPVGDAEIFVREAAAGMVMMVGGPRAAEEPATRSDASGFFAVADLDRGLRYDVEVRRRGYVAGRASGIELPRFEPLEVVLDPASRVIGIVRDPKGDPIAGAKVLLRRTRTLEMGGRAMAMMMMEDGSTDQEGRFVFEDQEPGTISLSAVASGYREARRDDVEIPRGEDLTGVEIPLPAGAILEGRVLGADGRAALGAEVGLVRGEQGLGGMMGEMDRVGVDGNGYYRLEGLGPGPVSIEAVHPDYPRAVRDVELEEGRNALDLTFAGGQSVSGRVTDTEGNPLAGADVQLVASGRAFGGPSARSNPDGTFTMPGVRDGTYDALASAEGFATSARVPVSVAAQPVAGLELRLDRGATITGRVIGLAPERFAATRVEAEGRGPESFGSGAVDVDGAFRIEHLPPGAYTVRARLQDSGRQAVGQAVIEPGSPAVRVDLEFGRGLELSGVVTQAGEPRGGLTVFAEGVDVDAEGFSETDVRGKFRIDGLEPGSFRVHVRDFASGLAYSESVDLSTSRELSVALPTASVSGRVRDAADREPLSGVTLTLVAADEAARPLLAPHTTSTDLEGRFTFAGVADGSWRLAANHAGHAARVVPIELELARSVDDVEIDLDPTEGLTVESRLPGGAAPEAVLLAVLDASGGRLVGGSYSTGENGRVRLASVPAGEWELLVSAPGSATAAVRVRSPGPPVAVELPPATRLRVEVPELAGTRTVASVSVADASGRAYRELSWGADARGKWTLEGGSLELAALPPGNWSVTVAASDGRSWTGRAVTQPGAPARVTLE